MKASNIITSALITLFFLAWMVASYQNYSASNDAMAFNIAAFIVSMFNTLRIIAVTPVDTNLGIVALLILASVLIDRNSDKITKRLDRMFK